MSPPPTYAFLLLTTLLFTPLTTALPNITRQHIPATPNQPATNSSALPPATLAGIIIGVCFGLTFLAVLVRMAWIRRTPGGTLERTCEPLFCKLRLGGRAAQPTAIEGVAVSVSVEEGRAGVVDVLAKKEREPSVWSQQSAETLAQ